MNKSIGKNIIRNLPISLTWPRLMFLMAGVFIMSLSILIIGRIIAKALDIDIGENWNWLLEFDIISFLFILVVLRIVQKVISGYKVANKNNTIWIIGGAMFLVSLWTISEKKFTELNLYDFNNGYYFLILICGAILVSLRKRNIIVVIIDNISYIFIIPILLFIMENISSGEELFVHFDTSFFIIIFLGIIYFYAFYYRDKNNKKCNAYNFLKNLFLNTKNVLKIIIPIAFILSLLFLFFEKLYYKSDSVNIFLFYYTIFLGSFSYFLHQDLIINLSSYLKKNKKISTKLVYRIYTSAPFWLFIIFGLGTLLRLWYSLFYLGYGGDENQYYYDSYLFSEGLTPLKDFHTRAVPFIYLLGGAMKVFGSSVIVGRLFTLICSTISGIVIYKLSTLLFNKKVGLFSTALFLFTPLMWKWNALVITEIPEVSLLMVAVYLFFLSIKKTRRSSFLILNGIILLISILIRVSALVVLLVEIIYLFILLIKDREIPLNLKRIFFVLSGFIFLPFLIFGFYSFYKNDSLIFNIFLSNLNINNLINRLLESSYGFRQDYDLLSWVFEILYKNAFFMIFPFFVILANFIYCSFPKNKKNYIKIFSFSIPILIFAIYFIFYYPNIFAWLFLIIYLLNIKHNYLSRMYYRYVLFFILCIIFFAAAYTIQPRMEPIYFYEFLPWLAIIAGLFIYKLFKNIKVNKISFLYLILFFSSMMAGYFLYYNNYLGGIIKYQTLNKINSFKIQNISENKEIFTASVLIASHNDLRVPYDISHPTVYFYPWTTNEALRKIKYPTIDELNDYLIKENIEFVFIEDEEYQTKAYYFKRYPEFKLNIDSNYYLYEKIDNIGIYKRKNPIKTPQI